MAQFNTLNSLTSFLQKIGYKDVKQKDARSLFVLTNKKRSDVFSDLISQLGGRHNHSKSFGGSLGHIDVGNYRIAVKPLSRQGTASAGVENEVNLVQAINNVIEQSGVCDVIFTDGSKKFTIKSASKASRVGEDTAGRKKADLLVYSGSISYPISLKKDNAEYWESADTLWKENAVNFLTKAVAKKDVIVEPVAGGVIKITPSIAIEATPEEAKNVIFGSDIFGKGCVVTRTFKGEDFNYDGKTNTLTIDCSNLIINLNDVPDSKKVWFLIRNDSTRKSITNFPGTRALASYKSRATSGKNKLVTVSQRNSY